MGRRHMFLVGCSALLATVAVMSGVALATATSSAHGGARMASVRWERLAFSQPAGDLSALAVDARRPNTLYVGVRLGGVYKTTDGGRRWQYVGLRGKRFFSLAVHPAVPRVVYAGVLFPPGVATSRDAGRSWATASCCGLDVLSFAFDPRDRQVVYAGGDGVWKSHDGGGTWTYPERTSGIGGSHVNGLSVVVRTATTPGPGREAPLLVYAAVGGGGECSSVRPCVGGVFRSTDAGRSWLRAGLARTWIVDVAVEQRRPWIVYAAATAGTSVTRGGSPCKVTAYPPDLSVRQGMGVCAAASRRSGVYTSRNAGRTWQRSSTGLPLSLSLGRSAWDVTSLVLDPVRAQTLYLGTSAGVFRSTDGARTWRAFGEGLGDAGLSVAELAISPDGSTLYAVTSSGRRAGLWTLKTPDSPGPH